MLDHDGEELIVLGPNGEVELSTSGAPPGTAHLWAEPIRRSLDDGRRHVVLACPGVSVAAWRLNGSQPGVEPRILVSVRHHPGCVPERGLTPRQREICEYAAAGATMGEVAKHLSLSLHTVRSHLRAAYRELGVSNRVELARLLPMLALDA